MTSVGTIPTIQLLHFTIILYKGMGVGVSVTVRLFFEIRAYHGKWKDFFPTPLFIRISKHNEW
jgi:hypothetical protein